VAPATVALVIPTALVGVVFGLATVTAEALFLVPAVYAMRDDRGWLGALAEE